MLKNVVRVTELPTLPPRPNDAHKGTFGSVLLVAGSRGMSGAATLAGLGALRGGAGLVHLAVPQGILPIVAAAEPSYLTIPLPEDEQGGISASARTKLSESLRNQTAIAIGPGWGRSNELAELARWLFTSVELPMVVDADALNALASLAATGSPLLSQPSPPRILTPHPGEFSRLTGKSITDIQANREELVVQFARTHHVVTVLKGQHSVITDGERLAINATGNSGMATGGTGDVLTGLIAALLAQGLPAFDAAQLAVHVHGLAGDLAAANVTRQALIASDLPKYLPQAWKTLGSS